MHKTPIELVNSPAQNLTLGMGLDPTVRDIQREIVTGQTTLTMESVHRLRLMPEKVLVRNDLPGSKIDGTMLYAPENARREARQRGWILTEGKPPPGDHELVMGYVYYEWGAGYLIDIEGWECCLLDYDEITVTCVDRPLDIRDCAPKGYNLLLEMDKIEETRLEGSVLFAPATRKKRQETGTVISCGEKVVTVDAGDHVLIEYAAGSDFTIAGKTYRCVVQDQVWAVL
jgi:co-chaperonin GroES (HSP10)